MTIDGVGRGPGPIRWTTSMFIPRESDLRGSSLRSWNTQACLAAHRGRCLGTIIDDDEPEQFVR
jgi:hypothetical protein